MLKLRRPPIRYGPFPPTQASARLLGAKHYYTGDPCSRGHVAPRFASNAACMDCHNEKLSEYHKNKRATDEQWRERKNAQGREIYHKDPSKSAAHNRAWRSANPDRKRAYGREYMRMRRADDPNMSATAARNRRARIRGNGGRHTAKDIEAILVRQKYKCAECLTSVKSSKCRHVDHIMPIALGGSNWPSNLQVLCPKCNMSKNARHPADFARLRGRLL